jgi:hypothetical protein
MRSDLLLICDDDVLPERDYIATFVRKYRQYGPDVVLCARGHVFLPHTLDEEHPEVLWGAQRHLVFYDEQNDDCHVHFFHADNCLIPKHILRKALSYNMERYEFALVDDYWLSFVVSHWLKVPIVKIKADRALSLSASNDDPAIALYLNDLVNEQRVNFYVQHMRQDWPQYDSKNSEVQ